MDILDDVVNHRMGWGGYADLGRSGESNEPSSPPESQVSASESLSTPEQENSFGLSSSSTSSFSSFSSFSSSSCESESESESDAGRGARSRSSADSSPEKKESGGGGGGLLSWIFGGWGGGGDRADEASSATSSKEKSEEDLDPAFLKGVRAKVLDEFKDKPAVLETSDVMKERRAKKYAKHPEWDEKTKNIKGMKADAKVQRERAQAGQISEDDVTDMVGASAKEFLKVPFREDTRPTNLQDITDLAKTAKIGLTTQILYGKHEKDPAGDPYDQ
jgi:hypothetical protein